MGKLRLISLAVGLFACIGRVDAACPKTGQRDVAVKSITDGDTFVTADGREVELAGVLAPGSDGNTGQYKRRARETLSKLLNRGAVSLALPAAATDRYGRLRAQVFVDDAWAQGVLLREGQVRAVPDAFSSECAAELLAIESEARTQHRGHWGGGQFTVRSPEQLDGTIGTFQVVEGTVQNVTMRRGRAYVNFGADWRTDFTVTVAPEDMPRFREAGVVLRRLKGNRVRVRGWVESYYGPQMGLALPQALEDLEPPKVRAKKKRPRSKTSRPRRSVR
ncbi:MAG: thermonuclease family protein [Alphaproteobacteria bacterium]